MKNIVIAAAMLLPIGVAQAQGPRVPGAYVGASVGYARNNVDCFGFSDCNKGTAAGRIFGGYQVNDMFGIELSYFDLGTSNAVATVAPAGRAKIDVKSTGFGLRGIAAFPANDKTRPYVALGVNRVKSDPQSTAVARFASETSTRPEIAAGVDYTLTPNLRLRGEFSAIRFSGADNIGSYTNANLSVGVRYAW